MKEYGGGWAGLCMNLMLVVMFILLLNAASPRPPTVLSEEDEERLEPKFRFGKYFFVCLPFGCEVDEKRGQRLLPHLTTEPKVRHYRAYCARCGGELMITKKLIKGRWEE